MDRNISVPLDRMVEDKVALLAEGVDRNKKLLTNIKSVVVALLAEGVDRNPAESGRTSKSAESPSS